MRFDLAFLSSLLLTSAAAGVIDPAASLSRRDVERVDTRGDEVPEDDASLDFSELWKRRGGGGGGGRGGGGGGRGGGTRGSSSRGGSRGSSRGGSRGARPKGSKGSRIKTGSSSGGGRGGGSSGGGRGNSNGQGYNTKSNSNVGGYSRLGSGPQPSFGGGKFYGGGAKVPYAAGNKSPGGNGINPAFYGGSALAFWPGYWAAGAYAYPYSYHHHYYNKTSKKDEERPIICGCAEKEVCSCEEIEDNDYWEDIIDDGDYSKLNKSVVNISKVNGTTTILLNGTLPKGTTLKSDDEDDWKEYVENAAGALRVLGLWPAVAAVGAAVLMA